MRSIKIGLATVLLSVVPALAHHAFSSEFDPKSPVTLSGTIQSVEWSNPHVVFHLNVATGGGNQSWSLEAANPATLTERGYTQDLFKTGTIVTFEAYKGLSNQMLASARAVTLPDGKKISVSDPSEDGGPAPTALTSQGNPTGALPQTGSNGPLILLVGILATIGAGVLSFGRVKA